MMLQITGGNLIFNPVSYNIGKHIPGLSNLYFGPFVGYGNGTQFGLGFKIGL